MTSRSVMINGVSRSKPIYLLLGVIGITALLLLWRLFFGLGSITALNDGYPKGVWLVFNVLVGTGLACGGYSLAILVYALNNGRLHALIRPALVTSVLGYTLGGLVIVFDIGRYWNLYELLYVWYWNPSSVMLELALCISTYIVILWIELSPAFLEKWHDSPSTPLRRFSLAITPILNKSFIWIIALGLLLPTMHQSSLGSLMMIATHKLHKLWHTGFLPLLFLISSIGMGYAVVVSESILANRLFKRPIEIQMLASLSRVMVVVLFLYVGIRLVDIAAEGRLGLIFAFDRYSLLFLIEIGLFIAPAVMLLSKKSRFHLGHLFRASMLMMLAGSLYRFSVFLIAFNPGEGWSYFPSFPELVITLGLVALQVVGYIALVRQFPALGGLRPAAEAH